MNLTLKITLIAIVIFFNLGVLYFIKKEKFELQYYLLWIFVSLALIISIIFHEAVMTVSAWFGFEKASNFIFCVTIIVLLLIIIKLTSELSRHNREIRVLTQKMALLKKEFDKKNTKEDDQ